jgi:hypothetical protein
LQQHPAGPLLKLKAGSAEGLAQSIGDASGKAVLLYPDELSHLLTKAKIENASFPQVLNDLFYEDFQKLTVVHRKEITLNTRLSIAGGIVTEQFDDCFGAATTTGLYDRFLFALGPEHFSYVWKPFDEEPVEISPTRVEIDSSVFDERKRWRTELEIEPRVAEIAFRSAIICASFDGRTVLHANDLGPALALAKCQMRIRQFLKPSRAQNAEAVVVNKIVSYLKLHEGWVNRRELVQKTHVMDRFGPTVVQRAFAALRSTGDIEERTQKDDGRGRPSRFVRLVN